jgi:hypothetical protein
VCVLRNLSSNKAHVFICSRPAYISRVDFSRIYLQDRYVAQCRTFWKGAEGNEQEQSRHHQFQTPAGQDLANENRVSFDASRKKKNQYKERVAQQSVC